MAASQTELDRLNNRIDEAITEVTAMLSVMHRMRELLMKRADGRRWTDENIGVMAEVLSERREDVALSMASLMTELAPYRMAWSSSIAAKF